ncbi:uncharacterized protein LOC132390822 [Hypanus sabinus]|uniref:uncharacterized protein LOC132390822 n=1 Tax=Hypanus sabinus TaxID=79690 RepID=UPI0028C46854|nr:uncharacterized protein LOC132390822 [Hypanus sabinus]
MWGLDENVTLKCKKNASSRSAFVAQLPECGSTMQVNQQKGEESPKLIEQQSPAEYQRKEDFQPLTDRTIFIQESSQQNHTKNPVFKRKASVNSSDLVNTANATTPFKVSTGKKAESMPVYQLQTGSKENPQPRFAKGGKVYHDWRGLISPETSGPVVEFQAYLRKKVWRNKRQKQLAPQSNAQKALSIFLQKSDTTSQKFQDKKIVGVSGTNARRHPALENRLNERQKQLFTERIRTIYSRPKDTEMKARHKVLLKKRLQHETERKTKTALHQQILKNFNIMRTRRLENSRPHDELLDASYPKRKGPSPYRQKLAATYIQKFVRGWLLRITYNRIKIKALSQGKSLSAVVRQYRQMMTRLRRRFHAPWEPIPLVYSDFEDWLNRKKKYEDMFAKREFWKEINKNELPTFFQDCDHYPSLREINQTWALINAGSYNSQSDTLTKKQVVDLAFTIYPPPSAGLGDRSTYRSTWVRPVVNGEEGFKYILADHPILKEAKIEVVGDLVTHSMFQRNQIQKFSKN